MKITRENRLWFEVVALAAIGLERLADEEIQELYGSDYYAQLQKFLKKEVIRGLKHGARNDSI